MDKTTLRKQLLANAAAMCQFAERELAGVARTFEYEYEHGFIYQHRDYDYIRFAYYPSARKAEVSIHHCGSSILVEDGRVFQSSSYRRKEDITDSYLTNMVWFDAAEVEKALVITQDSWPAIKRRIAEHRQTEESIMNFQL